MIVSKILVKSIFWLAAISCFWVGVADAQVDEGKVNPLSGIKFEVLGYVDYSNGQTPLPGDSQESYNDFTLTRGYFTFKKSGPAWIGMRVTMDVYQDNTGDYKVREKYLYAELKANGAGPLTDWISEVGLGHIPWLDFEEHINPFRCQGTMAIERAGVFNSADVGISIRGNLDGKLIDAAAKTGNSSYDGRYGSWHLGVYNGGGYHASENNNNKVVEGRLTIRPIPEIIPGLQLSYFGAFGKGNTISHPDYSVNLGMLSFEHPRVILTGQYFATAGNAKGNWVSLTGEALKTAGYSVFGDFKVMPDYGFSVFGRYDHFDIDKDHIIADESAYDIVMAGVSYTLSQNNLLLVDYETTAYGNNATGKGSLPSPGTDLGADHKFQAVYQIQF